MWTCTPVRRVFWRQVSGKAGTCNTYSCGMPLGPATVWISCSLAPQIRNCSFIRGWRGSVPGWFVLCTRRVYFQKERRARDNDNAFDDPRVSKAVTRFPQEIWPGCAPRGPRFYDQKLAILLQSGKIVAVWAVATCGFRAGPCQLGTAPPPACYCILFAGFVKEPMVRIYPRGPADVNLPSWKGRHSLRRTNNALQSEGHHYGRVMKE